MFYQPDFIVYLWILPVFCLIVLPLCWLFCGKFYRWYERSRLADVKGFIEVDKRDMQHVDSKERRQHVRIGLDGGKACIDEESDCCKSIVPNISQQGICLKNIPRKMYMESGLFRVVFRTREKDYSMMARPRWKKTAESGQVIGAELIKVPAGWNELNRRFARPLVVEAA